MFLIYFSVLLLGLYLLVKSADYFVNGAANTARYLGLPPLLVGMLIIGFGTSAPEWLVSVMAAVDNSASLAVGNAYGSNIANIALILGITALVCPIKVQSSILKKELPILTLVTGISLLLLQDAQLTRLESILLLFIFTALVIWSLIAARKNPQDALTAECEVEFSPHEISLKRAIWTMLGGLAVLMISSKMLIWSATAMAKALGISDLIIGLTIVAIGTSLPELASSLIAAKRGEDDLALGNIIGSNLFNTLMVIGTAGTIAPFSVQQSLLQRDLSLMTGLTILLFILGAGFRGRTGRINRYEGGLLLSIYLIYLGVLIAQAVTTTG